MGWRTLDGARHGGSGELFPRRVIHHTRRRDLILGGPPGVNRDSARVASRTFVFSGSAWTAREDAPAFNNLQAVTGAPDGTLYVYQSWESWISSPLMHVRDMTGVWRRVESSLNPGVRNTQALAWDSRRNRLVLYGGATRDGRPLDDTWEFDGREWTGGELLDSGLPTAACQQRLANSGLLTAQRRPAHGLAEWDERERWMPFRNGDTSRLLPREIRGMAYRNLAVLDAAERVADMINTLIDRSPRRFHSVGQMRRSALAIGANIREGIGRGGEGDKRRSYEIARGEAEETIGHLSSQLSSSSHRPKIVLAGAQPSNRRREDAYRFATLIGSCAAGKAPSASRRRQAAVGRALFNPPFTNAVSKAP